ncbi:response regulator [Natronococcus pandeyae]|uniref:Response regulator n=1 Tax=Natronococcus pandeyae TaxID=2055836 RepID=A0A8J8TS61_9EURY|nr:response regulator [Natronococcus pandeyae]TYL40268.1 response regulator [Natronococcus pandeyae]
MSNTATDGHDVEILLVEDNPGDIRLLREAMAKTEIPHRIHTVRDGSAALEFVEADDSDAPRPDIVLLDLNLPQVTGDEVLAEFKADPELRSTPVILFSSSRAPEDVRRAYELGANAYLSKPIDPDELEELVQSVVEFWFETANLPTQ